MKKLTIIICLVTLSFAGFAQDTTRRQSEKEIRREQRQQKVSAMIRQEEEGVLSYRKQSVLGIQLRTNGYGAFYELGRMQTPRRTTTYSIELSEIKHPKEEKSINSVLFFGNPYVYGKINNFYQVKLGFGQQYIFGQKGNKNGVAVTALGQGGISLGLLRPYYIEVQDPIGETRTIKYTPEDSAVFVDESIIIGGAGFGKGWGEIKLTPGAYIKTGLRFDYGRYNEVVSALEIGLSLEAYSKKIPIMLFVEDKQLFFQGYIAILFGKRK